MEQEIWGIFPDHQTYTHHLVQFTHQFDEPTHMRRLAISFWDPSIDKDTDTRIRITNGTAELMQKCGAWEDQDEIHMEEIHVPLPSDVDYLYNMYRILRNNLPLTKSPFITEYSNSIFLTDHFEIKLSEQHGKQIRYTFEIERLADTAVNLQQHAQELGLDQYITKTTVAFWDTWAQEMDIYTDDLTDQQLRQMIGHHLTSIDPPMPNLHQHQ